MATIDNCKPEGKSIVNLIGWLSTCLVVAGWGPVVDPTVRNFWALAGAFGLISALILQGVQRARMSRECSKQRAAAEQRMTRDMDSLNKQTDVANEVEKALQEIVSHCKVKKPSSRAEGSPERWSLAQPVRVTTPSTLWGNQSLLGNFPMTAIVRDISSNGVGIEHDESIKAGEFVLTFAFDDGRGVSLLVELRWWSQLANGKYCSGGRILQVQPQPAELATCEV